MFRILLFITAFAPSSAVAAPTISDIRKAYADANIAVNEQVIPIDEDFAQNAENAFISSDAVAALRGNLAGDTIYAFRYSGSNYYASFLEHDEEIVLSHFYLPVFSLTGSSPPEGFVEISTKLTTTMIDGLMGQDDINTMIGASVDEAHAYAAGTSTEPHPGVIHRSGPGYQLTAHALVPDWITLTTSRLNECPYVSNARGWLGQYICAIAGD